MYDSEMYIVVEGNVGPASMVETGLLVKRGERDNKTDAMFLAQKSANTFNTEHRVYPPGESIPKGLYWKFTPNGKEYNLHTGEWDDNAAYGRGFDPQTA